MKRHKVYLAGPITGLTYDEGQDWRTYAQDVLEDYDIEGFSPLRAKSFLASHGKLEGSYSHSPLSTQRGIMTRDHNDVQTADLILVNYDGVTKPSRGTDMEMAWAYAYRKPLVICAPDEILNHPMVAEATDFRAVSLDHALELCVCILTPSAKMPWVPNDALRAAAARYNGHAEVARQLTPEEMSLAIAQNEGGW